MSNQALEELLEELYLRQVEGQRPQEEPLDETALASAREGKLVAGRNGGLTLTDAGLAAGGDVIRRHRLAECLLRDVLGVADDLEAEACEFEHIIQHGLDEKICTLLGHPRRCPHDKSIPQGNCCRTAAKDKFKDVGPLSEGKVDAEGVVAYLQTRDHRDVQKMMALGILPGVRVKLIRRFPSYVFELGFSQFTVDRELASKICVRWK